MRPGSITSNQWKYLGVCLPKEAKTGMSTDKVMASIFSDAKGMKVVDYLNKGHTITGAYYADLLFQLREKIKQIRQGKLTKGVFFHQDNAPDHTSTVAMAAIQKCGFHLVDDSPYSPDLAPSRLLPFPENKEKLSDHHFARDIC